MIATSNMHDWETMIMPSTRKLSPAGACCSSANMIRCRHTASSQHGVMLQGVSWQKTKMWGLLITRPHMNVPVRCPRQHQLQLCTIHHAIQKAIPSSLSLAATVKPVCSTGCEIAQGHIRVTDALTPSPCVTIKTLSPFASSAIAYRCTMGSWH